MGNIFAGCEHLPLFFILCNGCIREVQSPRRQLLNGRKRDSMSRKAEKIFIQVQDCNPAFNESLLLTSTDIAIAHQRH